MTEQSIASLGLKVESSQVEAGTKKLDELVDASARAEQSQEKLGAKSVEAGKKIDTLGKGAQAAAKNFQAFDPAKGFLDEIRGQLGGMNERLRALGGEADTSGTKFDGFSNKARNALLTLGGIDSRFRAAISLFQEAPLRILGVAAAVGVLAKAYLDGANETTTFARAIALTNNSLSITIGQLAQMADRLDAIGGTRGAATETLATLASTGKVGAENLERFAAVAQRIKSTVGTPVEETAKTFASLADQPSKAAAELQKRFNFLTPAVYNYIVAQEKAGDIAGAAATAQNAYAAANERALQGFEQNVPLIVRGWNAIKSAAAETWDAMLGVGRTQTPEERLQELVESRGARPLGELRVNRAGVASVRDEDREEIALRRQIEALNAVNAAKRRDAAATAAYIEQQQEFAKRADEFAEAQKRINAAWAQSALNQIDRNLSATLSKYQIASEELDALKQAGLVRDEQYYAKRRELLQASANAEIDALKKANATLTRQDEMSATERIAAQDKIAANTERIAEIRRRTGGQLRVLEIEQQSGLDETAKAYDRARESAEDYVRTLQRRYQIELQGLGQGSRERDRLRERGGIEDKFDARRRELDGELRRKEITQEQYDKLLKIEESALEESLSNYDDYYSALEEKQGDWRVGAAEALHNFLDDAKNVAKSFEDLFTRAFDGMTDSLVEFAMTGKSSFGDLAKSILADLLKIELRVALSNILGSIFGDFGLGSSPSTFGRTNSLSIGSGGSIPFGGGRANGGPVQKGVTYLVNENTPRSELFTAPADGWVGPAGQGGTVINNYNTFGAGASRAELEADLDRRDAQILAQVQQGRVRSNWRN